MRLCWLLLLAACHGETVVRTDATPKDAGAESQALIPIEQMYRSPDRLCIGQLDRDFERVDPDLRRYRVAGYMLNRIANSCAETQPLLADAARRAAKMPPSSSANTLLKAARKHPAFPKECDVSDADAAKPASVAFAGRPGCFEAEQHCWLTAGMQVFLVTLAKVGASEPGDFLRAAFTTPELECKP